MEIALENHYPRLTEAGVDPRGVPSLDAGFEDEPDD
jgi:hypothetical protein